MMSVLISNHKDNAVVKRKRSPENAGIRPISHIKTNQDVLKIPNA